MTLVDSLRQHHPDLILVDGGDWGEGRGSLAKSLALFQGMNAMQYDVLALGRREMESALWDSVQAFIPAGKMLVGNLQFPANSRNGKDGVRKAYRVVERKGLKVGVFSLWLANGLGAGSPYQVTPPADFLREQLNKAKKVDARIVVLYGNGNSADSALTATVGKFPEVDAWLLAGGAGRAMKAVSNENGVLIAGPGDRGRELGFLAIDKGKDAQRRSSTFASVVVGKWVNESPAAKPFLEKARPQPSPAATKAPPVLGTRFIGTGSCKLCHEQIFNRWRDSKHAHAFETLVAKKEQQNEKCVACHTTGYGQPNGYGKAMEGVELAAVGCEACHGPGEYHVSTGNHNNLAVTETVCRACHTTEMSPKFVFAEYAKKVH